MLLSSLSCIISTDIKRGASSVVGVQMSVKPGHGDAANIKLAGVVERYWKGQLTITIPLPGYVWFERRKFNTYDHVTEHNNGLK